MHQEEPVRSWAEEFLDKIVKFFGFDGYKSENTLATEKRNDELNNLKKQLPVQSMFFGDAFMRVKKEIKEQKEEEQDLEHGGPKTPI